MLRVAVVLREPEPDAIHQVPSWVAELLQRLISCPFATLHTLIYVDEPAHSSTTSERFQGWLFRLYERWDESRRTVEQFALAKTPLSQDAMNVAAVHVTPSANAANTLRELDADVFLFLDTNLGLQSSVAARFGSLLLDISDTFGEIAAPPVWRQHVLHEVVTTRVLHASSAGALKVYETTTAVNPFSLAESRNPVFWKAVEVVLRSLQSLDSGGQTMLDSLPLYHPVQHDKGMKLAHFAKGELRRRARARSPKTVVSTFAKWCIGIRKRAPDVSFDSPGQYHLLVSPRDRFYADPFLFQMQGKTWLFFEDFRYSEGRAVISCCEVNDRGEPQSVVEVLRLPYHLSYPFVFEHEGEIYMIPESRGNRTVSLYRAHNFPDEWTLDTHLFTDVHMVDSTLHHDGESWWLFAAVSNGKYSNSDELCVYYADTLRGPWTPHPQNPVISDVRRARPAGRIFYEEGRWIRPSQDCGPAYGYGLVFSEIQTLTRERYSERVISELHPGSVPGNTANHTYDRVDGFEVIDRFFIESRLAEVSTFSFRSELASNTTPHSGKDHQTS